MRLAYYNFKLYELHGEFARLNTPDMEGHSGCQ